MKFIKISLFTVLGAFLLNGCLVYHKISYEFNMENGRSGKAVVNVYDIRSDAETDEDYKDDQSTLLDYIASGNDFINQMTKEGKNITSRKIYKDGDVLNGKIEFSFTDINKAEGMITYEDGFYYLTLPLEDSVISTNGEIIISKDYKRVLWDGTEKNIKVELLGYGEGAKLKPLSQFYKKEE